MCTPDQHQILTDRLDGLQAEVAALKGLPAEVTALKGEVALLRAWADSWPAERERGAISALMKAEIDLYRNTAEVALTTLADRIHDEITDLKGGMTEGAEAAIQALRAEVRGWSENVEAMADSATKITLAVDLQQTTLAGQKRIMERLDAVAAAQEQGAAFDAGITRIVEANREMWAEQKAERDERMAREEAERERQRAHDEKEKRARMARERRRARNEARARKWTNGIGLPLLLTASGATLSSMLNRAAVLSTQGMLSMSGGAILLAILLAIYWMALSPLPPADGGEVDERSTDAAPPPPGDAGGSGGGDGGRGG